MANDSLAIGCGVLALAVGGFVSFFLASLAVHGFGGGGPAGGGGGIVRGPEPTVFEQHWPGILLGTLAFGSLGFLAELVAMQIGRWMRKG